MDFNGPERWVVKVLNAMFRIIGRLRSLVIPLLLLVSAPANSEWQVLSHVDSMTDELKKAASVTNEAGYKFSIYRIQPSGKVLANFSLPENSLDHISFETPLIYRIDKNEPFDTSIYKSLQELVGGNVYEWQPTWVNFYIWSGDIKEGINDQIKDIMRGKKLLIRYYLVTGGYREASFGLDGCAKAISEAIDIDTSLIEGNDPD
jgi:hypothetical protein